MVENAHVKCTNGQGRLTIVTMKFQERLGTFEQGRSDALKRIVEKFTVLLRSSFKTIQLLYSEIGNRELFLTIKTTIEIKL